MVGVGLSKDANFKQRSERNKEKSELGRDSGRNFLGQMNNRYKSHTVGQHMRCPNAARPVPQGRVNTEYRLHGVPGMSRDELQQAYRIW